jgi:hypothetical protein
MRKMVQGETEISRTVAGAWLTGLLGRSKKPD